MAGGATPETDGMTSAHILAEVLDVFRANRSGRPVGVYSVCTAHPVALEAAMIQARRDRMPLVIEATANQVNQFGGYTGMRPSDFPPFIARIADRVDFPSARILLGGDHLGPVCWTNENAAAALEKARQLVRAYVKAGFRKIHLDTSMACADDSEPLGDEEVASRASFLCEAAEAAAAESEGGASPIYIIGTEVPPPGGATASIRDIEVTSPDRARRTIDIHQRAFAARGLADAWPRVAGLVVQPGVEFNHRSVHAYDPERAGALSRALDDVPGIVYEAHSTDYQPAESYSAMLRDHFAILKVGPQLTFALREALFALSAIEDELLGPGASSQLRNTCEQVMTENPGNWIRHYPPEEPHGKWHRRYSYSDRIRYYWNFPEVLQAVEKMHRNLSVLNIPLPLLSQYLPVQYEAVRAGALRPTPRSLAIHNVLRVTSEYSRACRAVAQ